MASRVNVIGLSKLIDHNDVSSEIDIVALEKSIFSGKTQQTMDSASKKFEEDMMRINSLVNNNQGSLDPVSPSRIPYDRPSQPGLTYNPYAPTSQSPPRVRFGSPPRASAPPVLPRLMSPTGGYAPQQSNPYAPQTSYAPQQSNPYAPQPQPQTYYAQQQTQEERTKQALRNLVTSSAVPQDRMVLDPLIEDEDKAILVDDISSLRQMLKDSGLDVSAIEEPRMDMSKDNLLRIRHRLQIKNDRSRASSVADELIMLAAKGMETIFNGEREIFGYKLDARGWSSSVRTKLRRMKYDTSVFIGEVMRDYSMSPKMRIAIEIVPSFVLYVASRKKDAKPTATEQDWENASMAI